VPDPTISATTSSLSLPVDHPTSVVYLDETGGISNERFFGIGCLKLGDASALLRAMQKLRDVEEFHEELKWATLAKAELVERAPGFARKAIDLVLGSGEAFFSCLIADRQTVNVVARYGSPWKAYEQLAVDLLVELIDEQEIVTVLADDYSTPDDVFFEDDVRSEVNARKDRLAASTVCRLSSKAADGLQLADLLLGAVAFDFRQGAERGRLTGEKAEVSDYLRDRLGVVSYRPRGKEIPGQVSVKVAEKSKARGQRGRRGKSGRGH
jgi:hypothetical protein